jgi:hypothetical protein
MKKVLSLIALALVFTVGCSTTSNFRIPADSTLMVTDRKVTTDSEGNWKTSPFFWSEAGGAPYRLMDKDGNVIRTGKLKTQFRVASIFWPPFALIYWPMGLNGHGYDLTKEGDGYYVVDNAAPPAIARPETEAAPAPVKKKKKSSAN